MSGKSIAKLAFACFLCSCYYSPPPIIIIAPAGQGESKAPSPPMPGGGQWEPYGSRRGNCMQFTQEGTDYCFWSWKKPMCPVPIDDCNNITNKCATPVTSNPPPC